MADYPKRPPHFAHKFCRKLTKAAIANTLGPEVCWLLTVIAHQEDAKRYAGPVNYWNEQLMAVAGLGSVDRLNRIRAAAIKAGWLFYKPGGKGRVGLYWVLIPDWAEKLGDGSSDESEPSVVHSQNTSPNAEPNPRETREKPETTAREPEDKCGTSNPSPSPSPSPVVVGNNKPRFVPPTVAEVAEHCRQRKNSIDAEYFVSHYEARGWKLNGGQLMKNWKAAIITWEKNDKARASQIHNARGRPSVAEHNAAVAREFFGEEYDDEPNEAEAETDGADARSSCHNPLLYGPDDSP